MHVLANSALSSHLKTDPGAMTFRISEGASLFSVTKYTFLSATYTSIFQSLTTVIYAAWKSKLNTLKQQCAIRPPYWLEIRFKLNFVSRFEQFNTDRGLDSEL